MSKASRSPPPAVTMVLASDGTFIAGMIAATWNDTGIAGINPKAKLMILEAAHNFGRARLEIGKPVRDGVLGEIPAAEFAGSAEWQIRLTTEHRNGRSREARFELDLDGPSKGTVLGN